jgi:hypothetical protein
MRACLSIQHGAQPASQQALQGVLMLGPALVVVQASISRQCSRGWLVSRESPAGRGGYWDDCCCASRQLQSSMLQSQMVPASGYPALLLLVQPGVGEVAGHTKHSLAEGPCKTKTRRQPACMAWLPPTPCSSTASWDASHTSLWVHLPPGGVREAGVRVMTTQTRKRHHQAALQLGLGAPSSLVTQCLPMRRHLLPRQQQQRLEERPQISLPHQAASQERSLASSSTITAGSAGLLAYLLASQVQSLGEAAGTASTGTTAVAAVTPPALPHALQLGTVHLGVRRRQREGQTWKAGGLIGLLAA